MTFAKLITRLTRSAFAPVLLLIVSIASFLIPASAQVRPPAPFEKPPALQPVYDGWYRNPDGTLSFSFGYINRTDKPIELPAGPNNTFNVPPAGHGQTTVFQPGTERYVFSVVMPKDFNQNLMWTLVYDGVKTSSSERGGLNPLYLISDVPPRVVPVDAPARPEFGPSRKVKVGAATKLATNVRRNTSDDIKFTYVWTKRTGPGDVKFEPVDAMQTSATFSAPGTYIVRMTASRPSGMDNISGSADFSLTVEP